MKILSLTVRIRYDPKSGTIKIAGPGLTASTVSDAPAGKRFHPNWFKRLAKALRDEGLPAPPRDADA